MDKLSTVQNGSVWLEEVEIALAKLIKANVESYDKDGKLIPTKVVVLKPEKEVGSLTYPCVTLYNYDQKFDMDRYTEGTQIHSLDLTTGKAIEEDNARPYNLYYQVEFWTEYLEDLNQMTRDWAERVVPFSTLECIDTKGNRRVCFMEQLKPIANLDNAKTNDSKRLFRRIYSYKISVELDNPIKKAVQLVTTPEIHIK